MNIKIKNAVLLFAAIAVFFLVGLVLTIVIYKAYLIKSVKLGASSTLISFTSNSDFLEEFPDYTFDSRPEYVDGSSAVDIKVWNYYLSHKDEYQCYEVTFIVENNSDVDIPMSKVIIENDFGTNMFAAEDFDVGIPVIEKNKTDEFILRVLVNTSQCSSDAIEEMKKELRIAIKYDYLTKDLAVFDIDKIYDINYSGKLICRNDLT